MPSNATQAPGAELRVLLHRDDKLLVVMHPPSAALVWVMEATGAEVGFVGTATLDECVKIAGWSATSVSFPIIMDGDTGHGGIMAQCCARDAANSSLEDCLDRLQAYDRDAGVDWVQLESPHSVVEIEAARARVNCAFSFMRGQMPHYLGLGEHAALGANAAWYPGFTHHVTWEALPISWRIFRPTGSRHGPTSSKPENPNPTRSPRSDPKEKGCKNSENWKNVISRRICSKNTREVDYGA